MNITANTPQPKKPPDKKPGRNYLSWIIFLGILVRPVWGILRSIAPPSISSQQIMMIVAGAVVLGVVGIIALRARESRPPSQPTYGLPQTGRSIASPYTQPPQSRTVLPAPPRSMSNTLPRAPQFEPMISGTVVLVGFVVAALIGGAIYLITVLTP